MDKRPQLQVKITGLNYRTLIGQLLVAITCHEFVRQAKSSMSRNLHIQKNQLFLRLVQKLVCPGNPRKKKLWRFEKKISSEKIYQKKFFLRKSKFSRFWCSFPG